MSVLPIVKSQICNLLLKATPRHSDLQPETWSCQLIPIGTKIS